MDNVAWRYTSRCRRACCCLFSATRRSTGCWLCALCFSVHGDTVSWHNSLQRGLCSRRNRQRRCQVRRLSHTSGGFPHAVGRVHSYSGSLSLQNTVMLSERSQLLFMINVCLCDSAARELSCPCWPLNLFQWCSSVWISSWPCWPFRFLTQWQATTSTGLALRPLIPECKTMTALSWFLLFLHYRCLHQELITELIFFVIKPYTKSSGHWAFYCTYNNLVWRDLSWLWKDLLSAISLDRAVGTFGKAKDVIVISSEWFVFLLRIRLISLASQKFISDIANDALQYCKMKGTASGSSRSKTKVGVFVAGYVIE